MKSNANIQLLIDCRCYTREALTSATYRLADRYKVVIGHDGEDHWTVRIFPKGGSEAVVPQIEEEFLDALTNAQLELDIQEKTADIRSLIVEHAFSPLRRRYQKKNLISRTTHFFRFISRRSRPPKSF